MKKHSWRTIGIVIALIGSALWLYARSTPYSAAPISARVVDAETGKPLAGVNVVAQWQLEGGLEGSNGLGALTVLEAETDADGRFQLPGWGPKDAPKPAKLVYANARVWNSAPQLLFFKSGYEYASLRNYGSKVPDPKNMRSDWDGKTIKLKPFRGTQNRYAESLSYFSRDLTHATTIDQTCLDGKPCTLACQWQNMPRMIRAIGRQFKSFANEGISRSDIYIDIILSDAMYQKIGCASAETVLGGDLK